MIEEAGKVYFQLWPSELESEFNTIMKAAKTLSERRNEIVHGLVGEYSSPAGPVSGLTVMPPRYAIKKRTLEPSPKVLRSNPDFAYTTLEIDFFSEAFLELAKITHQFGARLFRHFDQSPSEP
jgi:hypothetical protein